MNLDLTEAQAKVKELIREMDWEKYHTVRNLIVALNLESSELLEKIQWLGDQEVKERISKKGSHYKEIASEMADIMINFLSLCMVMNVDINEEIVSKCNHILDRSRGKIIKGMNSNDLACSQCLSPINVNWIYCPKCGEALFPEMSKEEIDEHS